MSTESTPPIGPWGELALTREMYGILQSLDSRPFSKGHDGAVHQAKKQLKALGAELSRLPRGMLTESRATILRLFIDSLDDLPPEVVARTLVSSLHQVLAAGEDGDQPCTYAGPPPRVELDQVVVAVGPTIGLGDEFLIARALAERAGDLGGTKLLVSSNNLDLWKCLAATVGELPPPPFGGYTYLDSLPADTRARTGYLYFDFLISDPSPEPYGGPAGIGYAGRWYMGNQQSEFVHPPAGMRYRYRYPDGLPACRWLESRWIASRVLPGDTDRSDPGAWPAPPAAPTGDRVVLQALTAKPELIFPPEFYRQVFATVATERPELTVELIPSPTAGGQAIAGEIADAVASVLPPRRVLLPEPMTLHGVHQRLREASVLFGPDTFSAHLAADLGVPQVTVSVAPHRAWVTLGAPCLGVPAELPQRALAAACAARIVAVLAARRAGPELAGAATGLRRGLAAVDRLVKAYLHQGRVPDPAELVDRVVDTTVRYGRAAAALAPLPGFAPGGPAARFDPGVYREPEDAARALVRWYHQVGLSDVVGLATAGPSC